MITWLTFIYLLPISVPQDCYALTDFGKFSGILNIARYGTNKSFHDDLVFEKKNVCLKVVLAKVPFFSHTYKLLLREYQTYFVIQFR